MSGLAKAVKKVWKKTTGKVLSKMNSVRKKIMKSKLFKVVAVAAAVYFGGAALLSVANGGTAAAGLGSAWGGIQGAGTAVMSGNFSGAASALSSGFTGGAAAGAAGTFAAGQAATAATITGNTAAATTAAGTAATAAAAPTVAAPTTAGMGGGAMLPGGGTVVGGGGAVGTSTATAAGTGGLLGEAGKAALITGGLNMAGSMIAGKAQADAAEDEQKRRTYWGVDGEGNQAQQPGGLLNPSTYQAYRPTQTPQVPAWQTSLDGLINRQKQLLGQG